MQSSHDFKCSECGHSDKVDAPNGFAFCPRCRAPEHLSECTQCHRGSWVRADKGFAWKCTHCRTKNREPLGPPDWNLRSTYHTGRGYSERAPNGADNSTIQAFQSGLDIRIAVGFGNVGEFAPWESILEFSSGDVGDIRHRYTATRIATFGIFAAAMPKRSTSTAITIRTKEATYVLMVKGLPQVVAAQLRPLIERWREHVPESSGDDSGESGQRDTASRLRDLQQLLDEGLITTEEFEQKRAAMIQEL